MNKKYDFGIVIGRFQPFHLAHQNLIKHSLSLAEKVIIILGSARSASDVKNPFTPAMREEIIRRSFPQEENRLIFRSVRDYPYNDHVWTAEVQNIVNEVIEEFEAENVQIPKEFKKYENFNRGVERLTSPDKGNFPIYRSSDERSFFINSIKSKNSAFRVKLITDELTETLTNDTQNNLLLIQEFVNKNWIEKKGIELLEPTYQAPKIHFHTTHGQSWTLDLATENSKPNKAEFEANIKNILKPIVNKNPKITIVGFFKDRSSYYLNLFPQWSFEEFYSSDKKLLNLNASLIREKYFTESVDWKEFLPTQVSAALDVFKQTEDFPKLQREFEYLQKYKADTRFVGVPFEPTFITTDAVVVQSGHILVIRRGHQPGKGLLALPGGFLASGLTLEDNAIKELKEETQIKVPAQVLRGSIKTSHVFDYPERSQRGRTITFAYFIELESNLKDGLPRVKGGDDAAKAFWLPLSALGEKEEEFFEDHYSIVRHFIGF